MWPIATKPKLIVLYNCFRQTPLFIGVNNLNYITLLVSMEIEHFQECCCAACKKKSL